VTHRLYLLATLVSIATACAGSGCPSPQGGNCTSTTCLNGSKFTGDTAWKTDVPKDLADSSASATVTVIITFAAAPTSADTAMIDSTGGTIPNNGIVTSVKDALVATYPASKLIALAKTYAGSDITSVTLATGVTQGSNPGSGCGVLGT